MHRLVAIITGALVLAGACTSAQEPHSVSSATTVPSTQAATSAVTSGTPRRLRSAFFGFNGASIIRNVNIDLLMQPELQRRLADIPARLIRIPTGTAAQWIDWRTGRFIDDPSSPFASIGRDRHPVTMKQWASLIKRTGATPVWDLNVLTSTLDDQIAMLHDAQRLGMPVRSIELGNELWDVRSIYPKVYPSGTAYATAMNAWIPELRREFPTAKIAVSGADPSDAFFARVFGDRYTHWNTEVLAHIKGADAIAIHPYWTLPDRAKPGSDVAATLRAGPDAFARFASTTLADIPEKMDVWLTEWNQAAWGSKDGTQIWAQALSVATVAMAQLAEPRITMSLVHDIVDGVSNPQDVGTSITFPMFTDGAKGSKPMQPTALGIALPPLFSAVTPDATVTPLEVLRHRGVQGIAVNGKQDRVVFVNATDSTITARLPQVLRHGWKVTTLRAAPDAQPGWVATDRVRRSVSHSSGAVVLPAYSVVALTPG